VTRPVALAALAVLSCGEGRSDLPPPPSTMGRANAVTVDKPEGESPPDKPAQAKPAAPAAKKKLCTSERARPAPKGAVKAAAAPDAEALSASIPFGVGKWIWLNLWAAWCGPCKEEMPRLIAWQKKLAKSGVMVELAFLSLDDDQRQLQRFLEAQPAGGVRASYWLPEGESRAGFMRELGVKETVALPVQAFVAPTGQITCVIEGVVEEGDYPAIAALVGAKP
jgi:thiol-disulfide isomerase/thioredoxin